MSLQYPQERLDSDLRVSTVTGAIHRALVECIRAEPNLTEEELLCALVNVTERKAERLRRSQNTPIAVDPAEPTAEPTAEVPDAHG